jgi:hypothetical protein
MLGSSLIMLLLLMIPSAVVFAYPALGPDGTPVGTSEGSSNDDANNLPIGAKTQPGGTWYRVSNNVVKGLNPDGSVPKWAGSPALWTGVIVVNFLDQDGGVVTSDVGTFCTDYRNPTSSDSKYRISDEEMDCRVKYIVNKYPPEPDWANTYENQGHVAARQMAVWHFADGVLPYPNQYGTQYKSYSPLGGAEAWSIIGEVNALTSNGSNVGAACRALVDEGYVGSVDELSTPKITLSTSTPVAAEGETVVLTVKVTQGNSPVVGAEVEISSTPSGLVHETVVTGQNGEATVNANFAQFGEVHFTAKARVTLPVGTVLEGEDAGKQKLVVGEISEAFIYADTTVTWERASIIAVVFHDYNVNGVYNPPSDAALPTWTVILQDESGNVLETAETGSFGSYTFAELTNGTYIVTYVPESGWITTSPIQVTVVIDGNNGYAEFGVVLPPVIIINKYHDKDRDGVQDDNEEFLEGWEMALHRENGTFVLGSQGRTDENGRLVLTFDQRDGRLAFEPGTYFVSEQLQGEWIATTGISQAFALDYMDMVTLTFGNYDPYAPASFGDYVWEDSDLDGVQDVDEPGVPGVIVDLYDGDGNFIATTTTDSDGHYSFNDITPSDYYVEITPPEGYVFTAQDQGGDDSADSDVNAVTGQTDTFYLEGSANDTSVDAGIYSVSALVSPSLVCVAPASGGQFTAYFDYTNVHNSAVTVGIGANNQFTPGSADQGQPTIFQPGEASTDWYEAAFSVTFDGSPLTWTLGSQSVTASNNSTICLLYVNIDEEWYDQNFGQYPLPPETLDGSFTIEVESEYGSGTCTYENGTLTCTYTDSNGNPVAALPVAPGGSYTVSHPILVPENWQEFGGTGVFNVDDLTFTNGTATHVVQNVEKAGTGGIPVCTIYGVDDQSSRNSQFFSLDLMSGSFSVIGPVYNDYDIEGIAVHPRTDELYAAGGDGVNANEPSNPRYNGPIYKVDTETGDLTLLGYTGHDDQVAASFNPRTGDFWVMVENMGLVTIDFDASGNVTGSTLQKELLKTVDAGSCTQSGECFTFSFMGYVDNGDGTTTVNFEVENHCQNAVSYVAFGTNGWTRTAPSNGSSYTGSLGNYNVVYTNDRGNPGFTSVKFETNSGDYFKNNTEQFSIVVKDFDATQSIQVKGHAGQYNEVFTLDMGATCNASGGGSIESIAWSPDGSVLYGGDANGVLWMYNPNTNMTSAHSCSLPNGQAMGLEFDNSGNLVGSVPNDLGQIGFFVLNLETCEYTVDSYSIDQSQLGSHAPDVQSFDFLGTNTCDILNPPIVPGSITIVKEVRSNIESNGISNMTFNFEAAGQSFNLKDGQSFALQTLTPGVYTITEVTDVPVGERIWDLTSVSCVNQDEEPVSVIFDQGNMFATLTLGNAQNLTCTFVNEVSDFESRSTKIQKIFLPLIFKN